MFDLTVAALGGRWVLVDDEGEELGAYDSQADALAAARDYARVDAEPRAVLIYEDDTGEWDELLVEPPIMN
jgi:predicted RNA polymerase sigma factor